LPAGCRSFLRDYENWLANRLTHLADHTHERVLRQFGRWHQLAKMRSKAKLGPLRPTAGTYAVNGFNRAVHFCDWLTRNQHALGQLSQTALDRYYCNLTPGYQHGLRPFLHWAIASGHMPRLAYSRPRFQVGEAMSQGE
jgi:hypothetical protein